MWEVITLQEMVVEYERIIKYLMRNEEGLLETLTEVQKEIFKKFKTNQAEFSGIDEATSFVIGFKLGLRFAAESFVAAKFNYIVLSRCGE